MKYSVAMVAVLMMVLALTSVRCEEAEASSSSGPASGQETATSDSTTVTPAAAKDDCISLCKQDHASWQDWEKTAWCDSKCMSTSAASAISGFFSRLGGRLTG